MCNNAICMPNATMQRLCQLYQYPEKYRKLKEYQVSLLGKFRVPLCYYDDYLSAGFFKIQQIRKKDTTLPISYIKRAIHNLYIDMIRKKKKIKKINIDKVSDRLSTQPYNLYKFYDYNNIEQQIIELRVSGYSNNQIASKLSCCERTVNNMLSKIKLKILANL